MDEQQEEIQKRLKEIGESFMSQFDDYEEEEEEEEEVKEKEIQSEMVEKEEKKNKKNKDKKSQNVTVFKEINPEKHQSIEHRSLDKAEKEAAVYEYEKRNLKKKLHEKDMKKKQELKLKRKKDLLDSRLDIKNNKKIKMRDERATEQAKLYFETKDFVAKKTKDEKEYSTFLDRELLEQGKQVKKKKNEYKSYFVLQQEIKQQKEAKRKQKEEEMANGMFDKRKERRERIIEDNKRLLDTQIFMNKYGAPSDVGRTVQKGAFKPRVAGSLGRWKNGTLILTKQDVGQITGKPWYKVKKN
eukprot:gene11059-3767_t